MRFKNCAPLLPLVGFLLLSRCDGGSWKEFTSPEGDFSILMPGTPVPQKQIANLESAGPTDCYMFMLKRNSVSYGVSYADYPEILLREIHTDLLFDCGRDRHVNYMRAKLFIEQNISLNGFPGREIWTKGPGDLICVVRIYLVKQRFYQILVMAPHEKFSSESVHKFLGSFTLISSS